jgi:hypothetical protein
MATISKTISEQMPTIRDARLRKVGASPWELVVTFQIGVDRYQAVASLAGQTALVTALRDLANAAIQAKVIELGYTVA